MSTLNLTAGAERILEELRNRFPGEASSGRWFQRLLVCLQTDEGRAAEILRTAGVTTFPDGEFEEPSDPRLTYLEWRRLLVRHADHYSRLTDETSPTGTEHFLLAAVELHSPAREHLTSMGLTLESLLEQVRVPAPELSSSHAEIQIRPSGPGNIDRAALDRILDASANRSREGLRVVEDFVRFHLDDRVISGELKAIRHQLTAALKYLGQERWTASRDTLNDVGTRSSVASERERGTLNDVLRANLKRVEEALRTLEEYGKLIDADLSREIADCRYRIYTVEKALETVLSSRARLQECRLYLLVTASACRYGPEKTIKHSLETGVDLIQIREKEMSDRDLMRYAEEVREWTSQAGKLLIINDRPDIAAAVGADGVHLGQDDLDVSAARKILGGAGLIGVSTHSPEQARKAIFDGADYLGVGPVFPSSTKSFSEFAGLDYVQQVADSISLPWFAIGGITLENLPQVQAAGATRIAVSSAICAAPHPRGVTRDLAGQLERGRSEVPS